MARDDGKIRTEPLGDMPASELQPAAGAVADWISSYLTGITTQPVLRKAREEMYHLMEKLPHGDLAAR